MVVFYEISFIKIQHWFFTPTHWTALQKNENLRRQQWRKNGIMTTPLPSIPNNSFAVEYNWFSFQGNITRLSIVYIKTTIYYHTFFVFTTIDTYINKSCCILRHTFDGNRIANFRISDTPYKMVPCPDIWYSCREYKTGKWQLIDAYYWHWRVFDMETERGS